MTHIKLVFARILIISSLLTLLLSNQANANDAIRITTIYTQAPLFKRLSHNAAIQVRIAIPRDQSIGRFSLQLTLDNNAVQAIEKLEILAREDREPPFLATATVLATALPKEQLIIPVSLDCLPGLNYFWISAVIRTDADIDKKIKIQVANIIPQTGAKISIDRSVNPSGNTPDYFFRLGIAVRKAGDDGVNTYRIPGLTTTDKGTLLAVYDIRYNNSKDLPENIDVGLSRSVDGGKTWQPMKVIMDMGAPHENNGIGDPSILFDPVTKKIWVAALWSKGNHSIAGSGPGLSPDSTGQFVLISSDDDGLTWSPPQNITAQVKNPKWHLYFQGPGNGIAMANGTLVFPSQYWDESRKPGIPHSSIIYSSDHGVTWKSGIGAKSNTTESQVVETRPGMLMLNMRDNRGNYRSIATTNDMGKTWVEHYTSQQALPDPVCMASIIKARVNVKTKSQDVLFFSNVATQNSRQNTTVKASLDLGETWPASNQLLIDARKTYGYSALSKIDEHTVGLIYEGVGDLYFVRIPVAEIIK